MGTKPLPSAPGVLHGNDEFEQESSDSDDDDSEDSEDDDSLINGLSGSSGTTSEDSMDHSLGVSPEFNFLAASQLNHNSQEKGVDKDDEDEGIESIHTNT